MLCFVCGVCCNDPTIEKFEERLRSQNVIKGIARGEAEKKNPRRQMGGEGKKTSLSLNRERTRRKFVEIKRKSQRHIETDKFRERSFHFFSFTREIQRCKDRDPEIKKYRDLEIHVNLPY